MKCHNIIIYSVLSVINLDRTMINISKYICRHYGLHFFRIHVTRITEPHNNHIHHNYCASLTYGIINCSSQTIKGKIWWWVSAILIKRPCRLESCSEWRGVRQILARNLYHIKANILRILLVPFWGVLVKGLPCGRPFCSQRLITWRIWKMPFLANFICKIFLIFNYLVWK
jgi:hypothetical protein